jgi:uncharacterized DUF497 family protein
MSKINVTWDKQDEELNEQKYGISLSDASAVFNDSDALITPDPDSSDSDSFVILGFVRKLKKFIVCQYRMIDEDTTKLTSARKAEKSEVKWYEVEWQ